jgi:hypothetical protein
VTTFSTSLNNITVLTAQSHDCSHYVNRPIPAPPPLWMQKHTELRPHDSAHSPHFWYPTKLSNFTLRLKLENFWNYSCCNGTSASHRDSPDISYRSTNLSRSERNSALDVSPVIYFRSYVALVLTTIPHRIWGCHRLTNGQSVSSVWTSTLIRFFFEYWIPFTVRTTASVV